MVKEATQRNFILGDEWLYIKLYTGAKTADTILTEVIQAFSTKLLDNKIIDQWFFLRYADPDFHLRVRFKISDISKLGELIVLLNTSLSPYMESKQIYRFQTDSYSRELERYGSNTISLSEKLFFYDSQMTVQLLDIIEGDEGETIRWHFALLAVDSLLNDFKVEENNKLALLDNLQQGFGKEFGMNNQLKVQFDKKFRNERQTIGNIIQKKQEISDYYKPLYEILKQKSNDSEKIINKIKSLQEQNQLEVEYYNLISSYIHMLLNRIFKSNQRLNELAIYSLLHRYYKSEIARKKNVS